MLENYILPFKGEVNISQGFNGPWSHKKIRPKSDYSYSLDFALPVNTEVIASREGVVKTIWERSSKYYAGLDLEEGLKQVHYTNAIVVNHSDGSSAEYLHLDKNSVSDQGLKMGDVVKQGQVIARTGLSGWIGDTPHLHFMVFYRDENRNRISLPVQFENYKGPLEHKELFIGGL